MIKGIGAGAGQLDIIELLKGMKEKMKGLGEKGGETEKTEAQGPKISGESLQKKIASIKDSFERAAEPRSSFAKASAEALADKFVKGNDSNVADKFAKVTNSNMADKFAKVTNSNMADKFAKATNSNMTDKFAKATDSNMTDKFAKATDSNMTDKFLNGNDSKKITYQAEPEQTKIRFDGGDDERKKLLSYEQEDSSSNPDDVKRKEDDVKRKDDDEKKSKDKKETEKVGIMETELLCEENHAHNSSCPRRIKSYREEEVPKQ